VSEPQSDAAEMANYSLCFFIVLEPKIANKLIHSLCMVGWAGFGKGISSPCIFYSIYKWTKGEDGS
jgi:hypothetical protein